MPFPSVIASSPLIDVRVQGVSHLWRHNEVEHLVLKDINLHVEGGEFISIVGPSGCGKSTLLRIIAGLQIPSDGEVLIGGVSVVGPRSDVGMVFQEASLFPWLTAAGNVGFGAHLKGVPAVERKALSLEWLQRVGLAQAAKLYPHQLSGGMKQRVAIARALANGAQVLLMDEPFAALDYVARKAMQELLIELWAEFRKTVIFVTHHIDEAVLLSDRVVMLTPGPTASIAHIVKIDAIRPRSADGEWLDSEIRQVRLLGRN